MDTYLAVASKRDWRSYADRPVPEQVQRRILDAGRLSGSASNRQPWRFVVSDDEDWKKTLAPTVYAAGNIETAAFVVAVATEEGRRPLDVGRAAQNMMLAAWNEGVASCPNGMPDPAATADALGLEGDLLPVIVLSFGYPRRDLAPESKSAEEWSAEANRLALDEIVVRRP
ncbi:MAG: nitroreductase family protein [Gaiellaceae bacterium]